MNKIVAIGSTNLVKSLLLSLFCPFVETKNKNEVSQQVCDLSHALLGKYAKFNRI